MERCSYCDETFESESALLGHLEDVHYEELGRIDRRRVDARQTESSVSIGTLALGAVAIVLILGSLVAVYFVLGSGSSGDPPVAADATITPHSYQSIHVHGTMEVVIDDRELHFATENRFIEADPYYFHFHGGDNVWHVHGEDVTLEYALATLGIEVEDGGDRLIFEGETYDDGDPATDISITVNGESVNPETYVLQGVGPIPDARAGHGDDVRIVVEHEE